MKLKSICMINYISIVIVLSAFALVGCGSVSFQKAYKLQEEGKLEEAVPFWEKALLEKRLKGEYFDAAIVLSNISYNYYLRNDYRKSIDYAEQSFEELTKVDDEKDQKLKLKQKSTLNTRLGNNYFHLGHYSKARDYFKEAERLVRSTGKSGCSGNLGAVYHILGDLDQAIIYYQKALVIDETLGGAHWLQNLAVVYKQQGKFKKAMFYQEKFENYCNENKGSDRCKSSAAIEWGRADILLQMGNTQQASDIFIKHGIKVGLGEYYLNTGNPQKAKELFEALLRNKHIDEQGKSQLWLSLGRTYEALGDFQNAEIYYRKAVDYFENQLAKLEPEDRQIFISGFPGAGSVSRAIAYQGLERIAKNR